MNEYHKIQTVFKRDMQNNGKALLFDQYSRPEFEYLKDNEWVFTEKVDGTNIRIIVKDGKVIFGGKTDRASIPAPLVERLREIFDILTPRLNQMFTEGACLYGEGFGGRIQKAGPLYGASHDFTLFDIKVGQWWLERKSVEDIAKDLDIGVVPIIGAGTLKDFISLVSFGFTSNWGSFPAEGAVARPAVELKARNGDRIITKLKTRDFQA